MTNIALRVAASLLPILAMAAAPPARVGDGVGRTGREGDPGDGGDDLPVHVVLSPFRASIYFDRGRGARVGPGRWRTVNAGEWMQRGIRRRERALS